MAWRGFTGLKVYELPLSNDLRELERWLRDTDVKLGRLTKTDWVSTPINAPPTYAVPASIHIYAIDGLSQTPGSTLEQDMYIFVNQAFNFNWTATHTWTPSSATYTPITINANVTQSADLITVQASNGTDYITADNVGLVGLFDNPTAQLSIRARALGDSDILALAPWAWYDAADADGNFVQETHTAGAPLATWVDRAGHPTGQKNLTNSTPANAMWYFNTSGGSNGQDHVSAPGSTGTGAGSYLSNMGTGDNASQYYDLVQGATISPAILASPGWTIFAVLAEKASSGVGAIFGGTQYFDGATYYTPGIVAPFGDGTGSSFSAISRHTTYPPGTDNEQYKLDPVSGLPDRRQWHVHMFKRLPSATTLQYDIDDSTYSLSLITPKNYPFSFRYLGAIQNGATATQSSFYYAELLVFNYPLTAPQITTVKQYLYTKYTMSGAPTSASVDLVHLKDNPGTVRTVYSKSFQLGMNVSTSPTALVDLVPNAITEVAARITGLASQSGNLQEWRVNGPTTTTFISPTGKLILGDTISSTNPGVGIQINCPDLGFVHGLPPAAYSIQDNDLLGGNGVSAPMTFLSQASPDTVGGAGGTWGSGLFPVGFLFKRKYGTEGLHTEWTDRSDATIAYLAHIGGFNAASNIGCFYYTDLVNTHGSMSIDSTGNLTFDTAGSTPILSCAKIFYTSKGLHLGTGVNGTPPTSGGGGVILSNVDDGQIVFNLRDQGFLTRASGSIFGIGGTSGNTHAVCTWDGSWTFGYNASGLGGTLADAVLNFIQATSYGPSTKEKRIGIMGAINHDSASFTPGGLIGVQGLVYTQGSGVIPTNHLIGIRGMALGTIDQTGYSGRELAQVVGDFSSTAGNTTDLDAASVLLKGDWKRVSCFRGSYTNKGKSTITNMPAANFGAYLPICLYTSTSGETWGLEVFSPTPSGTSYNTPAIAGSGKLQFPQVGTRRTHLYFAAPGGAAGGYAAPAANPTGNAKGDVYFDDGTNNKVGCWEHDGTAWRWLLTNNSWNAHALTAFTQTYATASHTHANPVATSVVTTAATNSSPYGYTTAAQADDIVAQVNNLITDMANVKQTLNALIDDVQAQGIAG